jgi:hypothetical protein
MTAQRIGNQNAYMTMNETNAMILDFAIVHLLFLDATYIRKALLVAMITDMTTQRVDIVKPPVFIGVIIIVICFIFIKAF